MRSASLVVFFALAAPTFAAPAALQPRWSSEMATEMLGAGKIAVNRLMNGKTLTGALELLGKKNPFAHMTEAQANAIHAAASKGDTLVIDALNKAARQNPDALATASAAGKKLINEQSELMRYLGSDTTVIGGFKYKANQFDPAVLEAGATVRAKLTDAQKAAKAAWGELSTAKKAAIITAGVVGTAAGSGAVLAAALELHQSSKSKKTKYPNKLDDEDMEQIEEYIQANPDQYAALIADIQKNVPGITQDQMDQLVALAPQSVIDQASSSTGGKSNATDEDDEDDDEDLD